MKADNAKPSSAEMSNKTKKTRPYKRTKAKTDSATKVTQVNDKILNLTLYIKFPLALCSQLNKAYHDNFAMILPATAFLFRLLGSMHRLALQLFPCFFERLGVIEDSIINK